MQGYKFVSEDEIINTEINNNTISKIVKKKKKNQFYVHFLWTIDGPDSSILLFSSNVGNDDKSFYLFALQNLI